MVMKDKYIVFDLDDTLAYEIDYLKSAFREIASGLEGDEFRTMMRKYRAGENVFAYLSQKHGVSIDGLLEKYRTHFPVIRLNDGAEELLQFCKRNNFRLGLISDGRSVTQRNKLKALGIEHFFDKVIISEEFGSEKPDPRNYEAFMENKNTQYIYIADNPDKDFISPKRLGWKTIALRDAGRNIHRQNLSVSEEYMPHLIVRELREIKNHLD